MNSSISVIVTVYNRFELTKRAVESVLGQTLAVSEVILLDDGSFDGTSELLQKHLRENARWRGRVRYVRQDNQGPGAARNRGIAEARGEWLAFIDNDDLWLPQKLEWQFRALDHFEQCDACITDAWFMNNPYMKMTLFQLAGKEHGRRSASLPILSNTYSTRTRSSACIQSGCRTWSLALNSPETSAGSTPGFVSATTMISLFASDARLVCAL